MPGPKHKRTPATGTPAPDNLRDGDLPVFAPYLGTAECDDPRKLIAKVDSLTPDPANPNTHPDKNMRGIRASLRRRGQQTPIVVDRDGLVIKGNGTLEAAKLEGWQYIWIVTTHLTGAELRAYGIADNATARSSENDWEVLSEHLRDLKALDESEFAFTNDDLGFDQHELDPILAADWTPPVATDDAPSSPPRPDGAPAPVETPAGAPHSVQPPPPDADDRAVNALAVALTPNMRLTIDPAIERVRLISGDNAISEGRCIELICADYMAGH